MEPTDIFKREVLRPFLTLAVPGSVAVAPYFLVAIHYYPAVFDFWARHPAFSSVFILLFATAVGVILDDLGTNVEANLWDEILDCKRRSERLHNAEWEAYLELDSRANSIAEDYLRSLLLKLKFELGLAFGLVAAWPGLLWFRSLSGVWVGCKFWVATLIVLALVMFLLKESYDSADLLGKARHTILKSRGKLPPRP